LFTNAYSFCNVPSVEDPEWAIVTKPLIEHVAKVKKLTTDEVVRWGKEHRHSGSMIRHMIAWLSFNDFVHYTSGWWEIGPSPTTPLPQCVEPTKPSGAETLVTPWKENASW